MQEAVEEEIAMMDELGREGESLDLESLLQLLSALCGGPPPVLGAGASVRDAVQTLATRPENCVVVADQGAVTGLVTARNVIKWLAAGMSGGFDASISAVTTWDPETLRLDDTILALLAKLYAAGFSCVPIVDENGLPLAVITVRDAFEGLLTSFDREIRTTPPMPYYGEPYVWGG